MAFRAISDNSTHVISCHACNDVGMSRYTTSQRYWIFGGDCSLAVFTPQCSEELDQKNSRAWRSGVTKMPRKVLSLSVIGI